MTKSITIDTVDIKNIVFDIKEKGYLVNIILNVKTAINRSCRLNTKMNIDNHELGGFQLYHSGRDEDIIIGVCRLCSYINGAYCFAPKSAQIETDIDYLVKLDGSLTIKRPIDSYNPKDFYVPFPVYFGNNLIIYSQITDNKSPLPINLSYTVYYYAEI